MGKIFKTKHTSFGFTLVELLVVVAVIGVLAGTVAFVINPAEQIKKAHDAQRKNDLAQMARVLEQYYNDFGIYPENDVSFQIVDNEDVSHVWGTSWAPYIDTLPEDPVDTQNYIYLSDQDGQRYYLYANIERGVNDEQICNPTTGLACDNATGAFCGDNSLVCNYGISSSNTSP